MTRESEAPLIRSRYRFTIHPAEGIHRPLVSIFDLDDGRSVTNDAERVFADLVNEGIPLESHSVIYRDTLGTWDDLGVGPEGCFTGFLPLGARSEDDALAKLRTRWQAERDAMATDARLEASE